MFYTSIDSIIADFKKKIKQLDVLSTKHKEKILANNMVISHFDTENAALSLEIMRARAIRNNLESIISIKD